MEYGYIINHLIIQEDASADHRRPDCGSDAIGMSTTRSRVAMRSISQNTLDNVLNFRDVGKNINEFSGKK